MRGGTQMRERFQELSPWYVNGTLGDTDRAWMDEYLAAHPEARSELAFFSTMATTMQRKFDSVPETIGMAHVFQRIEAERAPTMSQGKDKSWRTSWFKSLTTDLNWLRPALAMSLAVVALQSFLLMQRGDDAVKYRGVGDAKVGAASKANFYRVSFRATVTEGEVRVLLASMHAEIVAGPGANGEYVLRIQTGDSAAATAQLQASGLIVEVHPTVSP